MSVYGTEWLIRVKTEHVKHMRTGGRVIKHIIRSIVTSQRGTWRAVHLLLQTSICFCHPLIQVSDGPQEAMRSKRWAFGRTWWNIALMRWPCCGRGNMSMLLSTSYSDTYLQDTNLQASLLFLEKGNTYNLFDDKGYSCKFATARDIQSSAIIINSWH